MPNYAVEVVRLRSLKCWYVIKRRLGSPNIYSYIIPMTLIITTYLFIGLIVCFITDYSFDPKHMEEAGYEDYSFDNVSRIIIILLWPITVILALRKM